jgi:hypothetical protein
MKKKIEDEDTDKAAASKLADNLDKVFQSYDGVSVYHEDDKETPDMQRSCKRNAMLSV